MSDQTATIASLCVSTLQSLIVFAANFEDVQLRCRRRLVSRCFFGFINLDG